MTGSRRLTAAIEREDDGYVSFRPELDIASQGDTIEKARAKMVEAHSDTRDSTVAVRPGR